MTRVSHYIGNFTLRLIVLQVIMPNISFAGHLAGIMAGTLQLKGFAMSPSEAVLRRLDDSALVRRLTLLPSFVPTTSASIGGNTTSSSNFECNNIRRQAASAGEWIYTALYGRGHAENSNIRLGGAHDEAQLDLIPRNTRQELSQIV
jgi:hypothetical protein